jgi:hypothetical protein
MAMPDCFITVTDDAMDLELFTHNVSDFRFIDSLSLFEIEKYK